MTADNQKSARPPPWLARVWSECNAVEHGRVVVIIINGKPVRIETTKQEKVS